MKKTAILCLISAIAGISAGWFANQKANTDPYLGESYKSIAESRLQMIVAQDGLLHVIFRDNEDYWMDVITETDEYCELDSLREGDWEDFYLY